MNRNKIVYVEPRRRLTKEERHREREMEKELRQIRIVTALYLQSAILWVIVAMAGAANLVIAVPMAIGMLTCGLMRIERYLR